jgi:hypothetical protein
MHLTKVVSYALFEKHGCYVKEACDRCGTAVHHANRFTLRGQAGVWCSRECRDGKEAHAPGICKGCGVALNGKRKGARFCSDVCRVRQNCQDRPNNPKTHIQNKPLARAILTSGYGGSREARSDA